MSLSFYSKWVFIILPLFYLSISISYLGGIHQFSLNHFDGPYDYLMNGVNLASGHLRVGNIEHPGTPVTIFSTFMVFIRHLLKDNIVIYQDVLLHPESYLLACSIMLALFLSIVTYFIGRNVYRHSGNMLVGLLFQVSPLFCSVIIKMAVCLNAESSITICGVLLAAYLYINTTIPDKETTNKNAVIFGLLTAILFTTKIYCAPVILLVLFMIKKWDQRILYLISTGLFSLLLLFPLYNQFRNWLGSIKSMVFHSGAYGQGNSEVINSALYKNNIVEIFTTHHLFASVYFLVLLAFFVNLWNIIKKRKTDTLPITGICIFFNLFILIIAKQYKVIYPEPLTHQVVTITKYYYFIPLIVFFPLFISVSYKILSPLISFKSVSVLKERLFYLLFAVFVILGGQKAYATMFIDQQRQGIVVEKTQQFLDKWKNIPLILVSDGNKARVEPALFIGISYSGKWDIPKYMDFVKKIYPETYFYTTYNDQLIFWDHQVNISTIMKGKNEALVYLSGSDSTIYVTILKRICREQNQKLNINYKKVYSSATHYENIYLLKADSLAK